MTKALRRPMGIILPTLLMVWSGQAHGAAQPGPQPPCGTAPVPASPELGAAANIQLWSRATFGADWKPPVCTGWSSPGFTSLVTIAAQFRYTDGAEGLLRHIGAISRLAGMQYWSNTHKQWQTLIPQASALTGPPSGGPQSGLRREDFRADEMKAGTALYFEQTDNLTGKGVYRMYIAESTPDRLVVRIENVSTMRYAFLPIFHPGEMQSLYFLDRNTDDIWRCYFLMRTGLNASGLVATNGSSTINRAAAFYRSLVGIPTAQEPPAAR